MKLYRGFITSFVLAAATVALSTAIDFRTGLKSETSTSQTEVTSTTQSSPVQQTSSDSATSLAVVEPVAACSDLLAVDLTDIGGSGSNITAAEETDSDGITYCSVTGEYPPATGWQVMLPMANWTQRYMQVGCGGLCGSISIRPGAADGSAQVSNGEFVLASTDMAGGTDGEFGLDEDRRVAFAYLAVHQTALTSKKLIKAFYGQEAAYSYFNGCSDGGREAVMEAIRYPNDFDGIIAGAPAMLFTFQNSFHHGWLSVSNTNDDGNRVIITDRLSILHDAVIEACDALDGIEDGLLSDPRLCDFDPSTLECAKDTTDNSTCLTTAEVEVVTKFYTGPIDADSGKHLTVGEEQFGSELQWSGVFVPDSYTGDMMSTNAALAAIKYLILEEYPGDSYTLSDFEFANSTIDLLRPRHPVLDAVSPDLSKFHAAGGKLILWHGWADPHISPRTTIAYHEALQTELGEDVVEEFERLYLLPGVSHCGNGEGPSAIDLVTPMLEWVESDVAPNAIQTSSASEAGESEFGQYKTSSKAADQPARNLQTDTSTSGSAAATVTRPVYPYPAVAKYKGTGDVNDASNFEKGEPLYTNKTAYWLGQDFFTPYN
ncbi:Tannase and feruloyl esterase [Phytophthora boehmeriae]|uniref:feruloyl esterase n=1 Tax=Phytophthora boehmeriae TaxID=109152 RepID=A0A8T1WUZ4_9STRA|nr:Tannase and feruloyl esterase [Phytophthora boehmeriae]